MLIRAADELKAVGNALLDTSFPTAKGICLLSVTVLSFVNDESEAN